MKIQRIFLALTVSFLATFMLFGCQKKLGLAGRWSEKTNESDRSGMELELLEDGQYLLSETDSENGEITSVSIGKWTSDDKNVYLTPREQISNLYTENGTAKVQYETDEENAGIKMHLQMTDGENTYPVDLELFLISENATPDEMEKSGLLYRWADVECKEDYPNYAIFTRQYSDSKVKYYAKMSIDGFMVNGEVEAFTEKGFEAGGNAISYSFKNENKDAVVFECGGKTYEMSWYGINEYLPQKDK